MSQPKMVKIRIMIDSSTGLPFSSENLWAEVVGENQYRLDNIPFFVENLAYNDIVSAKKVGPDLVFDRLIRCGGLSSFMVVLDDSTSPEELKDFPVQSCEAQIERGMHDSYALACPACHHDALWDFLEDGRINGKWEFLTLKTA